MHNILVSSVIQALVNGGTAIDDIIIYLCILYSKTVVHMRQRTAGIYFKQTRSAHVTIVKCT